MVNNEFLSSFRAERIAASLSTKIVFRFRLERHEAGDAS